MNEPGNANSHPSLHKLALITGTVVAVLVIIFALAFLSEAQRTRVVSGQSTERKASDVVPPQVSNVSGLRVIQGEFGGKPANFILISIDPTNEDQIPQVFKEVNVVGVVLMGSNVQVTHVQKLLEHPTLKAIVLYSTEILEYEIKVLANANPNVKIQFVATTFPNRMPSQTRVTMKPLQTLPIDLPDMGHSDFLVNAINGECFGIVDMRETVVSRNEIEAISTHTELTELFVGYGFDDSMMTMLPRFHGLTTLDLSQSTATDQSTVALLDVPMLSHVTVGPNMTDETFKILAKSKTLRSIDASQSQISENGLEALLELKGLKQLDIAGRPLTTHGMSILASFPDIEHLSLARCKLLNTEDMEAILQMKKLKHLAATLAYPMKQKVQRRRPNLKIP